MADARWARLALEAGFLLAVAAVLAVADVEAIWIALVMLVAWIVVALLEWASWRSEAHWASGRPPRYYVPQQPLPPRPPTRELPPFTRYPRASTRETEAPTWIAPPELREQVLGWPAHVEEPAAVPELVQEETVEEPPPIPDEPVVEEVSRPEPEPVAEEPERVPGEEGVAAPPAFAWWPEPPPAAAEQVDDGVVVAEPELEEAPAVEPVVDEPEELVAVAAASGQLDEFDPVETSFVDEATFVEPPTGELAAAVAAHDAVVTEAPATEEVEAGAGEDDGQAVQAAAPEPPLLESLVPEPLVPEPPAPRVARHSIDPFPEPSRRRRWGRASGDGTAQQVIELQAPPRHSAPPPRPQEDEE